MTNSQDIQKKAILRHLHAFAPQDDQVDPLLVISLGRVLLKEARAGTSLPDIANGDQIRHIYDWLKAEVTNGAAWLSNVDEKGRPRKLMKFGDVDQILKEADKAMLKANQRAGKAALMEGDEEIVAELADGYTLVRMLTPAALDRESKLMQHCIGNGAYDGELTKEWVRYLSLRDPAGNPHVTMDTTDLKEQMFINQIKGKQNAVPLGKYLSFLRPWFAEMKASLAYMPERGLMVSTSEEIYHVSELPSGFECKRDFRAHELEGNRIPERLKVQGNMSVIGYDGENTQSYLPEGLYVSGDLTIKSSMIEAISKNTIVKGSLRAGNCSNITEIGEGLTVFGDCYLMGTSIEKLPTKLTVIGKLFLGGTKIKEISESSILSSLVASRSELNSVPAHIKEYDELRIDSTAVRSLPEGLSISKLSASNLNFISFPEKLKVDDNLVLYRSTVPVLHDTLELPLDSCFAESKIGEMRGDIVFEGLIRDRVDFTSAKIDKLPDSITVIGGDLILDGTDISTLPGKMSVTYTISLLNMENLMELPSSCELSCETLVLNHDSKFELPEHWKVKAVTLVGGDKSKKNMTADEYRDSVREELDSTGLKVKF